jgi:group II intron reverse transcriptase/maturase
MRIFKSHPLLKIVNSYLIDVRPVGVYIFEVVKHFYHYAEMIMMSSLGRGEILRLNIACLIKREPKHETANVVRFSIMPPTLRAILPKLKCLRVSKIGLYQCWNRVCYIDRSEWIYIRANCIRCTCCCEATIKDMSPEAKGEELTAYRQPVGDINNTRGLPKGGDLHGNRGPIVSSRRMDSRKSGPGSIIGQIRHCSGLTRDKAVAKLSSLYKRSEKFGEETVVERAYKEFVLNKDLHLVAYDKLKSKSGNMTPAIEPTTLDGISDETLNTTMDWLRTEKFQFSVSRTIDIPKRSGGTRKLHVGNPRDKLVQEVMRMVLEAIYEPSFESNSHGYRPNRSCHTALRAILSSFHGVWVIEGDLSKCFDSIDHNKLMDLIGRNIKDARFLALLWKALKAGYLDFQTPQANIIGTPQGTVISPILANIFLHQLDKYVEELKSEFEKGRNNKVSKEYRSITYKLNKARKMGDTDLIKKLTKERINMTSIELQDPNYRRLYYIRYADDWLIGISGPITDAQAILSKVTNFCESVGLKVNKDKTKITNIHTNKVRFLGTDISFTRHINYSRTTHEVLRKRKIGPRIMLTAPLQRVRKKLTEAGFIRYNEPYPKWLWLPYTHGQILHRYNAVYRGFINYYSFAQNKGALAALLQFYLKSSCARLLAAKFKLKTKAQAFKRFGKDLKAYTRSKNNKGMDIKRVIKFIKPEYAINVWDFKTNASPIIEALYSNPKSIATLTNLVCDKCGSDHKVEMHHVRHMRDLKPRESEIDRLMIKANRKQIPLCRSCHMEKHTKIK